MSILPDLTRKISSSGRVRSELKPNWIKNCKHDRVVIGSGKPDTIGLWLGRVNPTRSEYPIRFAKKKTKPKHTHTIRHHTLNTHKVTRSHRRTHHHKSTTNKNHNFTSSQHCQTAICRCQLPSETASSREPSAIYCCTSAHLLPKTCSWSSVVATDQLLEDWILTTQPEFLAFSLPEPDFEAFNFQASNSNSILPQLNPNYWPDPIWSKLYLNQIRSGQ